MGQTFIAARDYPQKSTVCKAISHHEAHFVAVMRVLQGQGISGAVLMSECKFKGVPHQPFFDRLGSEQGGV
jgi:hypothetical protein